MRNILLFAGSLLISILLAEGILHWMHPFDRMQTWIDMHDRGFVMNRAGGTAMHELDGEAVTYTFDENRFRINLPASGIPHPASSILLGDSYAFGLHLTDTVTLAHRMGWRNFAVGGAGPADYLAQMEAYLPLWDADTVIVLLSIDDATRTLAKDLYRLDGESQRWKRSKFRDVMEAIPGYHPLQKRSYLLNGFIRLAWRNWYFEDLSTPVGNGDSLYISQLHTQMFARMRDLCEAKGCTLVLASNGYTAIQEVDVNQRYLMGALPAIAEEIGVVYRDCALILRERFATEGPQILVLPTDSHPSAEGIKVVAHCLSTF